MTTFADKFLRKLPPKEDKVRNINRLAEEIHLWAREKGFWKGIGVSTKKTFDNAELMLSKLMLVTTEVAEAAEAVRHGDRENFCEEMADTAIRLFDLAHAAGVDLEMMIAWKMEKNKSRPHMHGKRA